MRGGAPRATPLIVVLFLVPLTLGLVYLARRARLPEDQLPSLALAIAALALLLIPYVALSFESVIRRLRDATDGRPAASLAIAATPLIPYLVYWLVPGGADPAGLFAMMIYIAAPAAAALMMPLGPRRLTGDLLVVLLIWLPVEFRWLTVALPWPEGGTGKVLGVVLGFDLLLFLMLVVRRFEGMGYRLGVRLRDLPVAVGAFLLFALVGAPLALVTGFIEPQQELPGTLELVLAGVGIYLFTGIPEEVLFRGFFQNFLERGTGRAGLALVLGSLLFGASHLNNGPRPDWRYFVLATLAGLAYGWVYQRRRRLSAPAVTHALVDVTWTAFF
jgi:membrane protease YdiL (CAAX protease family)